MSRVRTTSRVFPWRLRHALRETTSVPHFGMESSPEASPDVSKVVKVPMMNGHSGERDDLKAQGG